MKKVKHFILLFAHIIFVYYVAFAQETKNIYRINCGASKNYTDKKGQIWQADKTISFDAEWGAVGGGTITRELALPVLSPTKPEIYRSERYGIDAYRFKLQNGKYDIKLHFAETFECNYKARKREFDVIVNKDTIFKRFDPYSAAGGFARPAIIAYHGLKVNNGEIEIQFGKKHFINGIEINTSATKHKTICVLKGFPEPAQPSTCQQVKPKTYKVLFIGNSGTFFWAIPQSVKSFIESGGTGISLATSSSVHGGKRLEYHYTQTNVLEKIKQDNFDYVILQDASGGTLDYRESFHKYAGKFIKAIRKAGAEPVLYAYCGQKKYSNSDREKVMENYFEVAKKYNVTVVPVVIAMNYAFQQRPDVNFNNPDNVHLGMYGAYLITCSFYAVLSGKSPVGHPYPAVLQHQVPIEKEIARDLEKAVMKAINKYKPYTELNQ